MSTLLGEDTTILEDMMLDEAKCSRCPAPATFRVQDACCARAMNVCGECEAACAAKWSMAIILDGYMWCTRCLARFFRVEDAVSVNPI